MKKFFVLLLVIAVCVSLVACQGTVYDGKGNDKKTYSVQEFEELLSKAPLSVKSTKYVVQNDEYKALYPDMLQAIFQNNTVYDIKNATLAFVAWDKNSLPVKIEGQFDFIGGEYIKTVKYDDINLVPKGKYGDGSGLNVDESCSADLIKAIVVSYETFEGEKWANPLYDEWKKLYEGKKYDKEATVEVSEIDITLLTKDYKEDNNITENIEEEKKDETPKEEEKKLTEEEILSQIDAQEVKVKSTKYLVQDNNYKVLYPDMLQAILENNTNNDIKNAVVAFAAWDKNGLPVKIKGKFDFTDGSYITKVNFSDINLVPGKTFGDKKGYEVDESCGIKTVKAIVESYETFEGEVWENPLYIEWCEIYEGEKLK